jgi:hypothetical protein
MAKLVYALRLPNLGRDHEAQKPAARAAPPDEEDLYSFDEV